MQTWPSHHRPPNLLAKAGKKNNKFVGRNYPVLDHGAVEAATLVQRSGRFEWEPLVSARPAASRFRVSRTLSIFPITKSPPLPEPTTTINQGADQGAHFLRTKYPEVDISSDVIRDQITEDTLQATELAKFDPFEGNVLDIVVGYNKAKQLVFSTGELSAELNLTPITEDANGRATIKPTTIPVRTFSTPIQQIVSSPYPITNEPTRKDVLIGVRTFGATSLLKLDPTATSLGGVRDLTYFTSYDVGGASIVDVKVSCDATPFEALLATKKGGVYGCSLTGGQKTMVKLYSGPDPEPVSPFWRIGRGARHTECMVLSGKALDCLDFRSNAVSTLYIEPSTDFLTSNEDYAQDGLIRLCSTSQVIWLDPRYAGKPLLSYKHHRQFDRTLQTSTFFIDGAPTTLFSSKRNGMLTFYNVSRHDDKLIRVNDSPYGLFPSASYRRFTGQAVLQHENRAISFFRADEQAGVDCVELHIALDDDQELTTPVTIEESDAIKDLRRKAQNMKTDLDIFGDQEKVVADLFPAYDRVFRVYAEEQEKVEEEQAEEFYDVMDRLPTFWQTCDTPSEHMLTSYDIAFRSHEDPSKSSRSDFTTGSLINSARGFRAVAQDRFPTDKLQESVPWHYNIADIQHRIDPSLDLSTGARGLAESLRSYDLIWDDDRTALSLRRENNAREQLAVDLTLSKDVYSPSPFVGPREVGNDLETMTEALSLGGNSIEEPPEVEFGYLTPVIKEKVRYKKDYYDRDHEEEVEEDSTGKVTLPMGVRLLLKDWEVGSKAKDYIFQDPYDTTGGSGLQRAVHSMSQRDRQVNMMPSMSQVMSSQRPPTIMPSQALASGLGSTSQPITKQPLAITQMPSLRPTGMFGSQPRQLGPPMAKSQTSQDNFSQQTEQYMASTQVLPGPHGGRPSRPKKKPTKKRLGGF
ncbi:hypothetical protein D9756_001485 [Leucocoprinus leucothites]|uniref:Uncharacterized protein n=1 Tax=Leucocoprinus leucothites TaxID=201217 RepID=A0A8H5G4R6_9AGAR|nr:hypothetical protein D9756_001485 [Leucoagaricus leucothites]